MPPPRRAILTIMMIRPFRHRRRLMSFFHAAAQRWLAMMPHRYASRVILLAARHAYHHGARITALSISRRELSIFLRQLLLRVLTRRRFHFRREPAFNTAAGIDVADCRGGISRFRYMGPMRRRAASRRSAEPRNMPRGEVGSIGGHSADFDAYSFRYLFVCSLRPAPYRRGQRSSSMVLSASALCCRPLSARRRLLPIRWRRP